MYMKLFYENIHVADFATSHSLTIEEILDQLEFDEQAFIDEHGFDAIDYNDFRVLTGVEGDKATTRRLLTQFDELERSTRDDGDSYDWIIEHTNVSNALVRMFVRHIASEDWIVNSVTQTNTDDKFDIITGIYEISPWLHEWAEE